MTIEPIGFVPIADSGLDGTAYVTSDLHGGDGSWADDFAPAADTFQAFLGRVGWGKVWIAGDAVEGGQCRLRDIERRYPWLVALARDHSVYGNHDKNLVTGQERLRLGNVEIVHGHQADPWNSRYSRVGRAVTWIAGLLERIGWKDADNPWTWNLPSLLTGGRYLKFSEFYIEPWVASEMAADDRVALIFGHTHRESLQPWTEKRAVANAGSWVHTGMRPYTAVRIERHYLELLEVKP